MSLIFFAKVARISPRYKMHLVGGLQYARQYGYTKLSIGSLKLLMHNAYMLDRFISISGKSPKLRKNDTDFKELLFLGVRDAA